MWDFSLYVWVSLVAFSLSHFFERDSLKATDGFPQNPWDLSLVVTPKFPSLIVVLWKPFSYICQRTVFKGTGRKSWAGIPSAAAYPSSLRPNLRFTRSGMHGRPSARTERPSLRNLGSMNTSWLRPEEAGSSPSLKVTPRQIKLTSVPTSRPEES